MRGYFKYLLLFVVVFLFLYFFNVLRIAINTIPKVKKLRAGNYYILRHNKKHYVWKKNPDYTPLGKISNYLIECIITSEDDEFFRHNGLNLKKIWDALKDNLRAKRIKRGGSTITQQLVKNLFLTRKRVITRKIVEALLSLYIERIFRKDEILEIYLNEIQWGPNVFGVRQASEYYFEKTPYKLTLFESAFLTFIIPAPSKRYIYREKKLSSKAKKIIKSILFRTYIRGRIKKREYLEALKILKQR